MAKKTSHWQEKSLKDSLSKEKVSSRSFEIVNKLGLHARAAALFVKTSSLYKSEILIKKEKQEVNGKSIMGILMLAAAKGSRIIITAKGPDSKKALEDLGQLIQNKFGEGE